MPDEPGPKRRKGNVRDLSPHSESASESARRCSYEGCKRRPDQSSQFYRIEGGSEAGGQDWTELAGSVLCHTCYTRFRKRGTLERSKPEPLAGSARRCSYEGCKRPEESSQFLRIGGGSKAGGQDWTELAGAVLCDACYVQYFKRGRLERNRGSGRTCASSAQSSSKSKKACKTDIEQQPVASGSSSSSSSSTKGKRALQEEQVDQEGGATKGQAYDERLEECFMCLGSGTRVCIVPCGHSICAECGDAKLFKKAATRPFGACPVCREKMCKPWVMDGREWKKRGKTSYDP